MNPDLLALRRVMTKENLIVGRPAREGGVAERTSLGRESLSPYKRGCASQGHPLPSSGSEEGLRKEGALDRAASDRLVSPPPPP